jgi:DNA-binding NtrC family response regulator
LGRILVIDDSESTCEILAELISSLGHQSQYSLRLADGLRRISEDTYDIVLLDVKLPDGNGLEYISRIKGSRNNPDVIIITGDATLDGAKTAIEHGVWDYLEKPLAGNKVKLAIKRALDYREGKARREKPVVLKRDRIIGSSPPMARCLEQLAVAARSMAVVLITGETGTGKELFARTIHENSSRAGMPFLVVDCTTLTDTLVESILFGHVKGAFTGADRDAPGLVKQAHGGTLFLDEVGELPSDMQGVLLRVLQEGRFRPVGADKEQFSDFRLIAATNRDLSAMVREGRFRSDLHYRLKSLVINVPPLRDRGSDIVDIAFFIISELSRKYGTGLKGMSPEFLEAILSHDWPGNVRELVQVMESSFAAAHGEPTLHTIHLPLEMRVKMAHSSLRQTENEKCQDKRLPQKEGFPPLSAYIADAERQYLKNALKVTDGNIAELCELAGISRASLYSKLKKFKIARENKGSD